MPPEAAFIKELPFMTQVVINLAIFLITIVIGIRSYYASNKKEPVKTDVIVTGSNTKYIEKISESFEKIANESERMADALVSIERSVALIVRQNEIDREVRLIVGDKKRGGKPIIAEVSIDKITEKD